MSDTGEHPRAAQACHRCPAQHFSSPAEKMPPSLEFCPLRLQAFRNRKVHDGWAMVRVCAKRMLLQGVFSSYLFNVSSRFNTSLTTMVQAASSGGGIAGS